MSHYSERVQVSPVMYLDVTENIFIIVLYAGNHF